MVRARSTTSESPYLPGLIQFDPDIASGTSLTAVDSVGRTVALAVNRDGQARIGAWNEVGGHSRDARMSQSLKADIDASATIRDRFLYDLFGLFVERWPAGLRMMCSVVRSRAAAG